MKPFKFLPNRVQRLYTGGSGIDRLRGTPEPRDGRYPEDWIASCTEARNGGGISRLEYEGKVHSFPEFLHEHAAEILGPAHLARYGENPALLTKLLDSAVQLPLQVHPTKEQAQAIFHVPYGKTEAWIVLATREDSYLLVGFNKLLDQEVFIRESIEGVYRESVAMLHKVPVKPGDVVMIHGGLPHAIGPGVTMVEVMEPSDLVIVPEVDCCGEMLSIERRFAGVGAEVAMGLFNYTPRSYAELLKEVMLTPEELGNGLKRLIPLEKANGCFEAYELELRGETIVEFPRRGFKIGIVVEGEAEGFRKGDGFLIPWAVEKVKLSGNARIVFTLPPE